MKGDTADAHVYEDDSGYRFSQTSVLTEKVDCSLKVRDYYWLLKYTVSHEAQSTVVQVFVDFKSRYSFADKNKLVVTVEASTKKVTETFDLEKVKDQCFTVDLTKNGFANVKNDDVKVTCTVDLTDIKYSAEYLGTLSIFTASSRPHDVVLVVGEKKFYVHKLYLATWSKFFDTLFYGNFAEKDKRTVTLDDIDSTEFEALLTIIHPLMQTRICALFFYLLKLADRFDMPSVMAMCGNHLLDFENCSFLSVMDRLELSDKYSLSHLQVACLKIIHRRSAPEFKAFLDENRQKIRKLSVSTMQNLI